MLYFGLSIFLLSQAAHGRYFDAHVGETINCEHFDEQTCAANQTECEVKIENCGSDPHSLCMVVWRNVSGKITLKSKGCFSDETNCKEQASCISRVSKASNHHYCCCKGDLCNKEFFYLPLPSTPASTVEVQTDNENGLLAAVLIIIFVIMTGFMIIVFIKQKHRFLNFSQAASMKHQRKSLLKTPKECLLPITLIESIARGRFGEVWKAKLDTGTVAVKITTDIDNESWLTEQKIFKLLNAEHENLLSFIGAEVRANKRKVQYWLITDFHELGSLCDYLKNHTVTWRQLCHIAHTMASGLSYLHEDIVSENGVYKPSIAHRDFKSKNVLLKSDLTACIADFGLALILNRNEWCSNDFVKVGTRRYMAPELLLGAVYFTDLAFLQIDMYAFGLVLWEIVCRCRTTGVEVQEYCLPFEMELGENPTVGDMVELVAIKKYRPRIKDDWKNHFGLSSVCRVIENCWDSDAEARLSIGCALKRLQCIQEKKDDTPDVDDKNVWKLAA